MKICHTLCQKLHVFASPEIYIKKGGDDMKTLSKIAMTAAGYAAALPAFAASSTNGVRISNINLTLGSTAPETIVINIVNIALGFLALVAVILILIGGFKVLTSAGNEEKAEGGKKVIISAIIGLLIIMAAWGISLYAVTILAGVTGTSTY